MISVAAIVVLLAAAPEDSLAVASRLEPSSATIGDRVRLELEISHPYGFTVMAPDFVDGYGSLELLSSTPARQLADGGTITTTIQYVFQAIGLDFVNLPAFSVVLQKDDVIRSIEVPPMLLRMESVLTSADAQPRDLKPPLSIPRAFPFYVALGLLLMILALVVAAVFLMRRRRSAAEVEVVRPAHEIAFDALRALEESGVLESADYMKFFVELSRILREYIGRRYGFDAMEMTTTELGRKLRQTDIPSEASIEGLKVLAEADLVKFARHRVEIARRQRCYSSVWALVESTMETDDEEIEEEMSRA